MTATNFFLTDLMKTGNHQDLEQFLSLASLPHEKITCNGEYYTLHNEDLRKYDRLFAIIDHRRENHRLWKNPEYWQELERRIEILRDKGFCFILAHPWESEENMQSYPSYKRYLDSVKHCTWSGGESWFWFFMHRRHKDKQYKFDHSDKKYDFLYLNKQSRSHRKKLFDALQKEKLLDNSLFSFLDPPYKVKLPASYELPWVDASNYPRYGSDHDIYESQFNHTAFNLVSETNDNNHDVFITEKLWKPVIAQQIFVVHGNFEYLKKLNQIYNQEKENLAKKIITIDGSQAEENIANICIEYFNEYV